MGGITGSNGLVLFVDPRPVAEILEAQLRDELREIERLVKLERVELSVEKQLQLVLSFDVPIVDDISVRMLVEPDLVPARDGTAFHLLLRLTLPDLGDGPIWRQRRKLLAKLDQLKVSFRIPTKLLEPLVGPGPHTWDAGATLLIAAGPTHTSALALYARHDGDAARPTPASPLPAHREVALAIRGTLLGTRLSHAADELRKTGFPLGFRLDRLTFTPTNDALTVHGRLLRRWGATRRGATGVTVRGALRLS